MKLSVWNHSLIERIDNSQAYQLGLLTAITILAAALRFYKLGEWSFWFDEIFNVNRAIANYSDIYSIVDTTTSHKFLPLSIAASGLTISKLGISEWSGRLVPAIIGTVSIPILYFPIRKMLGWRVGLIASLLLSISTWHIFWSQNARFYTSILLLYTLALLAFFYAIEKDRPILIIGGFLLSFFAISERLFAAWLIPVLALYLLLLAIGLIEKPLGFRPRNIGLLIGLPVLGIVSIEITSLVQSGNLRFLTAAFLTDLEFFFQYRNDDPFRLLVFTSSNIGIPLMVFGFFSGIYLISKRDRFGLLMLIAALIPVLLILILNPFVFTKDRYVFVTLTAWIILTAAGMKELFSNFNGQSKWLSAGIIATVIASILFADLLYYRVNNGYRRDWKGAISSIKAQSEEDDIYVMYWPELGSYYSTNEIVSWQDAQVNKIANSTRKHWFLLDSETIWANKEAITWLEQHGQLIDVKYLRTTEDLFLKIYLFDPG